MFNLSNETHFSLTIDDFDDDLQVLSFTGTEGINQPYRFDLELVSENPDIDLEKLLHQQAFLAFNRQGNGVHGQIYRVAQGDAGRRLSRYSVTLVPRLQYLHHRTNQRIFQQMSAPAIIAQILEEHGIQSNLYRFHLSQPCPDRDYCVQYDETDLIFLQRLCEEEGMHYHFQHSANSHELVFGDNQSVFPVPDQPTPYMQDSGMVADEAVIKNFKVRLATRTGRVTRRDYDFEQPSLQLEAAYKPHADVTGPILEDYDYPGRFLTRERGQRLSQRAIERHRADYQQAEGSGDQTTLLSGHFLKLSEHPRKDWNDLWLLTAVTHEGHQPQVLEESITSDTSTSKDDLRQGYRNRFLATPWAVLYRPPLKHPKPRVLGSQTAMVTGPEGEEIHCDQYGRVKVQFHWDREGQADDKTSCWLRVSSGWAGDRYGGISIPRVGMEVLVTFLEGDPDQPLISGCLYHRANPVPYPLPANKTRTVFKTLSSPGGSGFNELRIEDKKGAEQIFLHAQRDWDENIENDQKIRVGNERHDTVEKNTYTELKAEEHRTTHADRKVEVRMDDHLIVAQNQHVKLGTAQRVSAGRELHLKAGEKLVIEAGTELTVKAGGSFIKLDASGITVLGPVVRKNEGGTPGNGSGIAILLPKLPIPTPSATSGNVLDTAKPGVLQPPPKPREYFFDIKLTDVPGDEGFPLVHTAWSIVQDGEEAPLLEGLTDDDGRVNIDDVQRLKLSQAATKGPLWLCYPGQRVPVALHDEPSDADKERFALAALDFHGRARQGQISTANNERSKQDLLADGDQYSQLHTRDE
jgi:type VI secretion system secreted protein VgrG